MAQQTFDVIVIGEGVSGLTAADTLASAGLKVATLEAQLFGGLVINVNELDPAPPGRPRSGAELASEMMQVNAERGVTSIQEAVTVLRVASGRQEVVTASAAYAAPYVVIASGARLKRLGVPGESEFEGKGVSQCADCDGPMYQNEDVLVVGGGDSARQEALVLAQYARRVHLVHRGERFSGERFRREAEANDKISIVWNATVERIAGGKMVEKAHLRHRDGCMEEIPCAGVFAYIGLQANADFAPAEIERDAAGFVTTGSDLQTSVPGTYAIGAVRSGFGGTLDDAIAEAQRVGTALVQRLG